MPSGKMCVERLNGISIVVFKGDFDAESVCDLENLLDCLMITGKKMLIIDMAEADFVGNSVISVLLGTVGQLRRSNGELKLCSVPESVCCIFELLEVGDHVDVFDDRMGAILSYPKKMRRHLSVQDRRRVTDRRRAALPYPGENQRRCQRRFSASSNQGLNLPSFVFA